MTLSGNALTLLFLLPWGLLWTIGGVGLVRAAFRLRPDEELLVGMALGWILENWLANLIVRFMPLPWAFWTAAGLVCLAGVAAVLRTHSLLPLPTFPRYQVLLFGLATLIFFQIGRGMSIFDDFAHLPTVSLMATGDIPPHFVQDPTVLYGYHHFLLLLQAQTMRLGGALPWVALDIGRALAFGTAVLLAALFTRRLTNSWLAGALGGAMLAFGSGTRWLLLLIPRPALSLLTDGLHMLGSGAASGETLANAMQNLWAVEGAGNLGLPFAFANGVFPPGVIEGHSANGLTEFVIIFLLLLTFYHWRSGLAAVLSAVLISVWGLLGEAELVGIAAGWGVVTLAYIIRCKTWRMPRSLWTWLAVTAAGTLIGLLEGGAWTDMLVKFVDRLAGRPVVSYQTIGFQFSAPAIVSSHLGVLPLYDPRALLVALLEVGPVLLALPLLVAWGIKAFRQERWYEAATSATALVTLLALFVQFSGSTGVRNTPRLYVFLPILAAFAAPLAWNWAARRSVAAQTLLAGLGLVTMLGGLVLFGFQLISAQRPAYSSYLTPLDGQMTRDFWNRLEPGALVFDPDPSRGTAVLGRATNSSFTWYERKPEWKALRRDPDPFKLRAAGYRYVYLDDEYWHEIGLQARKRFSADCVKQLSEQVDIEKHFRRLYDIGACQ